MATKKQEAPQEPVSGPFELTGEALEAYNRVMNDPDPLTRENAVERLGPETAAKLEDIAQRYEAKVLTPAEVDALDGPEFVELDVDAFVKCCDTISAAFKSIHSLFNPADSKGDLLRNQINLLDNQIEALRAYVVQGDAE
jgi:hypothetical protein